MSCRQSNMSNFIQGYIPRSCIQKQKMKIIQYNWEFRLSCSMTRKQATSITHTHTRTFLTSDSYSMACKHIIFAVRKSHAILLNNDNTLNESQLSV